MKMKYENAKSAEYKSLFGTWPYYPKVPSYVLHGGH